jgi:DNA-directed RNA polymerase subunit beta'
MTQFEDVDAIRLNIASPGQIKDWSHGEVTKAETINYRTLKPERDGLFCERIFGPVKDYECHCGKYKKLRYEGVICDKCGVEVTRSSVRRERMGHIELAAPVTHVWFVKLVPSRLGLFLGISPRKLETVIYFAQYIVISVDREAQLEIIKRSEQEAAQKITEEGEKLEREIGNWQEQTDVDEEERVVKVNQLRAGFIEKKSELETELKDRIAKINELQPYELLREEEYQELKNEYGEVFKAGMGAEAVLEILQSIDINELHEKLVMEIKNSSVQQAIKLSKRLQLVRALRDSGSRPEWMIITILPVLPPALRPVVQLDGGRFVISDLNDLYRRVINRNNRLRRLMVLGAPEPIIRNEKRMLQEAVDALIDNGRRGRAVTIGNKHVLKSLSAMLGGKQGRFRQNLLGKRVDYSGRSVIVVGPQLKLHQCGLPRHVALELFKPFVMRRLMEGGYASNVKIARRQVERVSPEVWGLLSEVVKERPVLLNRAPTLHRLSIQAFEPVLIDGDAFQLHPLVCSAFNADFDGDQMAVHVPLSRAAVKEAREHMLSVKNLLLPSNGEPVTVPSLDMVLGCYYLTMIKPNAKGKDKIFSSFNEAKLAYDLGVIDLGAEIEVRDTDNAGNRIKTTVGRVLFNDVLPLKLRFHNGLVDKTALRSLVSDCIDIVGNNATATVLDNLKQLGFTYATKSGISMSINDIEEPPGKVNILKQAEKKISVIEDQYNRGFITEGERYENAVETWLDATDKISEDIKLSLDPYGGVSIMANSGARGNISQLTQMVGMRGLMTNPSGKIIDFPIKSSFRDGLSPMEYFISTHGARKGLADTALRTSESGYLTRRLVDVAQDVMVMEEDCGTHDGIWISRDDEASYLPPFEERIDGYLVAADIIASDTGEIIVSRNEELNKNRIKLIVDAGITRVCIRSPLTCQTRFGICQCCYGREFSSRKIIKLRAAVGIIAAQSIGEPGTQLTLRTFHTGGVVGTDITTGLPRVAELLEARIPKGKAVISETSGIVTVEEVEEGAVVKITSSETYKEEYALSPEMELVVKEGQMVDSGTVLFRPISTDEKVEKQLSVTDENNILARVTGEISFEGNSLFIKYKEIDDKEYYVPQGMHLIVKSGDVIEAGQKITDGIIAPHDVLQIEGKDAVQTYLVDEVQRVYRSQGVSIHDKHIAVIVRQMLRKVAIISSGDTRLLPGELVDRFNYEDINTGVIAEGGEPASACAVLQGISRASLSKDSWLAAASFQETGRVLVDAATKGQTTKLLGLKENVILGKLIPSRVLTDEDLAEIGLLPQQRLKSEEIGAMSLLSDEKDSLVAAEEM